MVLPRQIDVLRPLILLTNTNMITTAYLFRYRIKEFVQFIRNTLMIVGQHSPDKLQIKPQYQALNKLHQQLEMAYLPHNTSAMNAQLAQLDATRDRAIVCLRMLSDGYSRHPSPALSEAGQLLLATIDKYGSRLYDLNYSAETAALKKLVYDLQQTPDGVQAVQTLQLEDVVSEIKRVNQEFERQFVRHLEAASQDEGPSVRELVQRTAEAYRTLLKFVEAHATLTPSSEYTLFAHHLNENIEHFNQIVDRRRPSTEAGETAFPTDATDVLD